MARPMTRPVRAPAGRDQDSGSALAIAAAVRYPSKVAVAAAPLVDTSLRVRGGSGSGGVEGPHGGGTAGRAATTTTSAGRPRRPADRKSTRLNSSHGYTSYAVFCLKKK